jgi:hypothetical protein
MLVKGFNSDEMLCSFSAYILVQITSALLRSVVGRALQSIRRLSIGSVLDRIRADDTALARMGLGFIPICSFVASGFGHSC